MTNVIGLGSLLLISLLLWWFARRAGRIQGSVLRAIPAFKALHGLLARAAESGQVVHLALGASGLGNEETVIASTGLTVLRYLADQGAALGVAPRVTVSDPALLLAAQDVLYRAYARRGKASEYRSTDVQLIAPDATAYAVGAQDTVNRKQVAANVMVGHFGDEYLLIGEAGAQRDILQVAGSDSVNAQPWILVTANQVLLGEEIFAAGAYLDKQPAHIGSLYVQDVLRVLIVVSIVIGVLAKTVFW